MMAELEDKEVPEPKDNSVPRKPVGKAMSSQRSLHRDCVRRPGHVH